MRGIERPVVVALGPALIFCAWLFEFRHNNWAGWIGLAGIALLCAAPFAAATGRRSSLALAVVFAALGIAQFVRNVDLQDPFGVFVMLALNTSLLLVARARGSSWAALVGVSLVVGTLPAAFALDHLAFALNPRPFVPDAQWGNGVYAGEGTGFFMLLFGVIVAAVTAVQAAAAVRYPVEPSAPESAPVSTQPAQ